MFGTKPLSSYDFIPGPGPKTDYKTCDLTSDKSQEGVYKGIKVAELFKDNQETAPLIPKAK